MTGHILNKQAFGSDFVFGVSSSAFQTEGAYNIHGKGLSIWDTYCIKGKIKNNDNAFYACDFYSRYKSDLLLMRQMNIRNFRFSISWPRILPYGTVKHINYKGIDFYNRVIDTCLELGITPWITLYHWDLPQALENKGGWVNRNIVNWFSDYAKICVHAFGDRVKRWMVLNEPMVFTGAGYFMGVHAPGKMGLKNFLPAVHHACLVQGIIPALLKNEKKDIKTGTTFSFSYIESCNNHEKNIKAALRADTLLNRLFIEPALLGKYPVNDLKSIERIFDMMHPDDENNLKAAYDFVGVQVYTREVVKHVWYVPYIKAKIISASKRKVKHTLMNWEVYPPSIYNIIKKVSNLNPSIDIYITENGAAFNDIQYNHTVFDTERTAYIQAYLEQVLKAKNEGANVKGYFVWSFTDNFEWAEGYTPRFGLVYVDFKTQQRIIKNSGKWYSSFLKGESVLQKETLYH